MERAADSRSYGPDESMGGAGSRRLLVLGAGAIGSILGGYLSASGEDVVLIDEWPEHVETIAQMGLHVDGPRGELTAFPTVCDPSAIADTVDAASVMFVACKSYDTVRLVSRVRSAITDETCVVSLQNGLNEDTLTSLLGSDRVVGAVTELGGYLNGPGEAVETRAAGGFVIGEVDGHISERLYDLKQIMSRCAPTEISDNITGLLWSKLWWNCVINPLTALTARGQGAVLADPEARNVAFRLGNEVACVASALEIALPPLTFLEIDPNDLVDVASGEMPQANWSALADRYRSQHERSTSMSQDVERGRRTEIDSFNGYVAVRGAAIGVATPVNAAVAAAVRLRENGGPPLGIEQVVTQFANL